MKNGMLFYLAAAVVLAGCGGGGGGGGSAAPSVRLPEPTPGAARSTTATQNLGSVTQSTDVDGRTNIVLDRVGAKLDDSGNPTFREDDDGDMHIVVENIVKEWEGSNDAGYFKDLEDRAGGFAGGSTDHVCIRGGCDTPVIDATGLTVKSADDYQAGDYYLVTGLWYENDNNFGVFADGPELTEPLPTSGSATYEGGAGAIYWDRRRTLAGVQSFEADVEFQAVADRGNVAISGMARNIRSYELAGTVFSEKPLFDNRTIRFNEASYNASAPGITSGRMTCEPNCRIQGSSWGGQFHGDPPAGDETDGWPFSFNGTFGIQALEYQGNVYDILGHFSTLHDNLDDAIASLRNGCFHNAGCPGPTR